VRAPTRRFSRQALSFAALALLVRPEKELMLGRLEKEIVR